MKRSYDPPYIIGCTCWSDEYTAQVALAEQLPIERCDPAICGCECHESERIQAVAI